VSAAAPRQRSRHRGIYYRESPQGRRWIVWFKDSDGKGRTETLPVGSTERDALARQAELRGKISRGERVSPSRVTLKAFGDEWLGKQEGILRPKTVSTYTWGLGQVYEYLGATRRLSEIRVDDVAHMVERMKKKGLSGASIKNAMTPLSRVLSHAVRRGILGSNPVKELEKHERPKGSARKMRILSSDEITLLLSKVPKLYVSFVTTAIFTGMRIGELLALRWGDVDFAAGLVYVREGKTNAAARSIVLMPALGKRLRAHKLASGFSGDEDLVFASKVGTPLGRRNVVRRGLEKGLDDASLEHLRFHDLRHTYASILIGQGLDVTFVCDQLGHADPSITLKTYAKLFDPQRRRDEARERLEATFGGMV
jgi:integrase